MARLLVFLITMLTRGYSPLLHTSTEHPKDLAVTTSRIFCSAASTTSLGSVFSPEAASATICVLSNSSDSTCSSSFPRLSDPAESRRESDEKDRAILVAEGGGAWGRARLACSAYCAWARPARGLVDHLVDVVVVDVNKEVLRRRRQRSGVGDGLDRHGEGGGAAMNGGMSFV